MDFLVVGAVYEDVAVGEELKLLGYFLLAGEEVLIVGLTDVGEDADGGIDDAAEVLHLASFGNAGLEDGKLVAVVHLPDGERHAYLRIVAAGAGDGFTVVSYKLDNPVLDNGLAVGARDAHHGNVVERAAIGGKLLEGHDDVLDLPEVGTLAAGELLLEGLFDLLRNDEIADSAGIEVIDIAATRVALGGDGKEETVCKIGRTAAVREEVLDVAVGVGHKGCGTF